MADSVEKLKNDVTAKFRGTHAEADFRQCNALWSACGGRPLKIALVMRSPTSIWDGRTSVSAKFWSLVESDFFNTIGT